MAFNEQTKKPAQTILDVCAGFLDNLYSIDFVFANAL